jgi:biotin-dependent carboxylase-like uncharacterized protein
MDAFSILTPGGYTTIQDKGRFGYQQMGVPISGALDAFAFRAANLLVGNLKNAAVMEITVMGPRLEIAVEADMAVTGAEIGMTLNDQPVEGWMSFRVKPGDILDIQQVKSGCRAYLAISGGIDVTEVMGSRSTYVGGKIGGFHGRVLQAGDVLKCGETKRLAAVRKTPADMIPAYPSEIVIRAIPGPQDDFFQAGLDIIFQSDFMVSTKADRIAWVTGSRALKLNFEKECPKVLFRNPPCREGFKFQPTNNPSY